MPYSRYTNRYGRGRYSRNKRVYGRRKGYGIHRTMRRPYTSGYKQKYRRYKTKWTKWQKATPSRDVTYRKFIYAESKISMSTSLGGVYQTQQVFRGNSCYDPNYTGIGGQPYGWDETCPVFWQTYKVMASKITIYMSSNASQANLPKAMVYLIPSETTAFGNHTVSDLMQIPYVKCKSMGVGDYRTGSQLKVSHYATTNRILGKEKGNDEESSAAYDSNPANVWYWLIYVDTSTWEYASDIRMDVKIKYYTRLSHPKSIAVS